MRYGLTFVNSGQLVSRDPVLELAQLADKLGFSTIWAADHVVLPVRFSSSYPSSASDELPFGHDTPFADPITFLAFAAAVTDSIRLATGVLILAEHNPVEVAKALATLDCLSAGRVTAGIGTGWLREEFDALGVPFAERLTRTTEGIAVMRQLWTGPDASFSGTHFRFSGVTCSPPPVQSGGIPIYLGGYAPAAARRAGRIADGYFPGPATLEKVLFYRTEIARGAADAGREPGDVKTVIALPDDLELDQDVSRRYEDAGVDEIVLPVPYADPSAVRTLDSGLPERTRASLEAFSAKFIAR